MKRRVISLIAVLTLCLNLCPVWAFAAVVETAGGLCPHHPEHTEECGYDPENPGASCTFVCPVCSSGGSVLPEASGGPEDPEREASAPADEEDSAVPGEDPGDSVLPTVPDDPEEEASAPADGKDPAEPGEAPGDGVLPAVPGEPEEDASTPEDGEDPASPGEAPGDDLFDTPYSLTGNLTYSDPLNISYYLELKTNEFTFTGTGSSALLVTGTGKLHLTGTIAAPNGVGVKVESGGVLYVTGTDTVIRSDKSYGLELDSSATAHLTGGTFIGKGAAIQAADLADLLEPGYAYFNSNGNLVSPADAAKAKQLTVGQCSNHEGNKAYTHDSGATTHSWTCPYCGGKETENCTFPTFDENGSSNCVCGNALTIAVVESGLANLEYDGTLKPGSAPPITVKLTDGTVLAENTDYTVHYEPRTDAGEITVTVTGITFNGTFTKTYEVKQAQPGISWDYTTCAVDYDGLPVDNLPNITINIPDAGENPRQYLQYSYRKADEEEFTPGLPTNAGEYEVKAYIPASQNYEEAETNPNLTLTIKKISPVADAPAAKTLTYNREVQELVTAGRLAPLAAADGAKILFATSQGGPYSEAIPTGINASTYGVWYKVEETGNCTGVTETKIDNVEIQRKHITPVVTLSDYTYLYDGGFKQPTVTVKDEDRVTVLLDTEYTVVYGNNRNVSTAEKPALVTVTDADPDGGNYDLEKVEVKFEITSKTQETLTIVDRPNTVTYGDKFILSTSGGSGSGDVTWEITKGKNTVATVGETSGQVTIVGDGEFTVKATKSGKDPDDTHDGNYEPATATWTVTADKKPVVATVTAEDKTYGETYDTGDPKEAKVKAVVEQGVLAGDVITITGLTGTFDDEHAGQDKTVTVVTSGASITGKNSEHYAVSYSSPTVKAAIHKAIAHITAAPVAASPTYNGAPQALITAATVDISGVSAEYSLSKDGPYNTAFPEGTNAGKYTVWYRIQETGDYTGEAPRSMEAEILKKSVAPTITLSGDGLTGTTGSYSYIYDGSAKEPVVTVKDGMDEIPASNYTVSYSNNTNVGTTAKVTVTAKADGNYTFTPTNSIDVPFSIVEEQAKVLTAPVEAGDPLVFNNRDQKLVTAGTASGGTMVYAVGGPDSAPNDSAYSESIPTRLKSGDYTVYYKVKGDSNHSDSAVGNLTVTIAPKTVKDPTIELKDDAGNPLVNYTYDGTSKTPVVIVKDGSTVIGTTDPSGENDEYNVTYSNNTDAGTATVSISAKPGGNYTVTGSTTFVIQKADIADPNPQDANVNYNGKPQELLKLNVTGSIGGEIQYALGSPNSAFAPAIPKETNAGTYRVYYRVVGDKNHNDLAVQSVDATINRKPLSAITIELSPESFVYDGGVKMPAVTLKDGKDVLPAEEYTVTCTDESDTVTTTPTNEGTYTITITDAANGNYDLSRLATPGNQKTFTIGKTGQAELAIDHSKATTTNYGDTFTLTTTGGNGNGAVTWKSTDDNIATVDDTGSVTIAGVGEVTIIVEKAADTNYEETQAQWTFTAAPKPVMAVVTVDDKAYDNNTDATVASVSITKVNGSDDVIIAPASIKATFETASVGNGKTVTLDASKVQVTGNDADKYAINYPATATANITQETTKITKAPAEITGLTYNGQPQALITAGETNVGFLVYSLDGTNFSKEIPTGTNAGMYTVHYKVDATADYIGAAGGTVNVTIDPKSITPKIELSETSYVYDGSKKEPKITVRDDKTVIDDDQYTITWKDKDSKTVTELKNVGPYTATIKSDANGNYTFVDSENHPHDATATVEIVAASQGSLKITGKPSHVYYGDTITTLDTTGGAGNGTMKWTLLDGNGAAPGNSTINPTSGVLEVKDVGTFTVTAERTVDNYATVTDTWTFTVEPKPVTAVVTVANKAYDSSDTATVTKVEVKSSDKVNSGDTITIDFTNVTAWFDNANVGTNKTVTIDSSKASVTAGANKYAVSYPATVTASITAKSLTSVKVTLSDHDLKTDTTVTPNKYYYIFNGSERKPNAAVIGTADGKNFTLTASDYTVEYSKNQNAGTAAVTVKAAAGGNYTFDDVKVEFEIRSGSAVLVRSPQAQDLTYNGTAQDLVTVGEATGGKVVYSSTGAANSYSEAIPQETKAGTYTVYYMVKGDANHSDTVPSQLSVTIKPKTITPVITLTDANRDPVTAGTYTYDGSAKEPTVTVQDGGDTIDASEYTVSYRDNTGAGTATVTISDNNGGDYTVNGTATFEIAKADAHFTTTPAAIDGLQYNGSARVLVKAGGSNDGTVLYSVNGGNYTATIPTGTAVADYAVSYKIQGDANHADTEPVTLNVEIAKNTVTNPVISLSSDQFTFNGGQQKPTIEIYDNGGNLIPKHEYKAEITGPDSNIVDVGTYTVTVTTLDSSNYVITTDKDDNGIAKNTRTFKIVPANQETISITGTKAQVHYGDTIQLGITGGTGTGTITWTVTDANGNAVSSTISATGLLTVKDVGGPITVTVERTADNHNTVTATWEFSAAKKQVTAVVTATDRPYDVSSKTVDVTAVVPNSELVSGDSIDITGGVTGTMDDPNVGTNKKVKVDGSSAIVSGTNAENYEITYPATTTVNITAEAATVGTPPRANDLTYDASQSQELVTAGTVTGGILVYSLDGANFTPAIPKAKDADTYTVYFKAQGDGNHTDSAVGTVPVTIGQQTVTPTVELSPSAVKYDGGEHKPTTVTLRDGDKNVIPTSEYDVTYDTTDGKDWTKTGTYTVKIENKTGGNYIIADGITATFTISTTAQNPLEITNKPGLVYYGDTFTLSAVGGSGNAKVTWEVDDAGKSVVEIDANGFVKIKGVGQATITAKKSGGDNYNDAEAAYPLNALRKPVTAIVTADDKVYDGVTPATTMLHFTWSGLVGTDTIDTSNLVGTFVDENVGRNKTVNIAGTPVDDATAKKYEITIPGTTTASITKADVTVPTLTANNRTYDGSAQNLVNGGSDDTRYSDSRDGVYTANVPKGTNAGTYTVWYKELGNANHNDSAPQAVTVTIGRKELTAPLNIELSGNDLKDDGSGNYSYVYDGTDKKPTVTIKDGEAVVPASEYTVSYENNKNVSTATVKGTVKITSNDGGNYTFAEQTVTFEITGAGAQLTSSPQARDLTYTGQAQELVTVGTASGGHIEYSKDGGVTYGKTIPTETDAGTYTVTYKVVADDNYKDSTETWTVSVTIKPKTIVSPKVTVSGAYTYNGSPQVPAGSAITVMDGTTTIRDTEYTVDFRNNVEAGKATVIITNANGGNYIVNGNGTFEIGKTTASVETPPTGNNLPYNGSAQALVTAGTASGGIMVYSPSQTGEYSPAIPTGTDVKDYTVWYKVQGDENHSDTTPDSVTASIKVNEVKEPIIQVTPEAATYTGKAQKLTVTVMDGSHVIDGSEYTVIYTDAEGNEVTDLTDVGKYTLTITGSGTHYTFTKTANFEILPADQTPLTITGQREHVYYGDKLLLNTTGGSGTVTWDVGGSGIASIDEDSGLLEISGVGSVTVTATSKDSNYADQTVTWSFLAEAKPVTAVVTAKSKNYDSKTDATVTATLQSGDLVGSDNLKITLAGSKFEDANAGTNKRVIVNSSNPTAITDSNGTFANYSITYPATATASIFKVDIEPAKITAPTAVSSLEYDGTAHELVEAGSVTDGEGTMEYSTDGFTYSASLPTGTNAKDYDVWYRVKGDGNHNDTAAVKLTDTAKISIAPQAVNDPIIEFNPTGATYDSKEHKPTVTVKDKNGNVIPDSEYTVTYEAGKNWTDAGSYEVKVENKADKTNGNYSITTATKNFTISMMGQNPLAITNQPGKVQYGDSFTLSTTGGSGTGAVTWSVTTGQGIAFIDGNGLVTINKAGGPVTVKATKAADSGYASSEAAWTFSVAKKPAKAIVTAKDKEFDGEPDAELVITWKDGDLVGDDEIVLELEGKFTNSNAGENKTVNITGSKPASEKYDISWNTTTTASITAKAVTVTPPTAKTNLVYTGQPQALVTVGTTDNGNLVYSLDNGATYLLSPPEATNAGTYTVWYKVDNMNINYEGSAAKAVSVTIKPKEVTNLVIELSPNTFNYDGNPKKPDVVVKDGTTPIPASEYTVSYSKNVQAGSDATVTISDNPGGNYTVSGTATFTIKSGAATLTQAPQERELTYNGSPQALVTAGSAVNGRVVYSDDDGVTYSTTIPKRTDAGDYVVYYKVVGNEGYSDTTPQTLSVTIAPKPVTPNITVTGSYQYTGSAVTPNVIVIVDGNQLTAGTDYIISGSSVNPGPATATVMSLGQNYRFTAIVTFEITKAKAEFLFEPEEHDEKLVYTGEAQKLLVDPGFSQSGTIVCSVNGGPFVGGLPEGTEVGTYYVSVKVQGDATHEDSDVKMYRVTIGKNTIAENDLKVTLSDTSVKYTGSEIKPTVTVRDTKNNVIIPASEYSVSYSNNINVGQADVRITSTTKNYSFDKTVHFTITDGDAPELTITGLPDAVYYGDTLRLSATGASGAVTWSIQYGSDAATTQSSGRFEITKPGEITITATAGSASKTVNLYADPKPVTATVIPADKTFNGDTAVTSWTVIVNGLVGSDTIPSTAITPAGQFASSDVGTQNVYITGLTVLPDIGAKYKIISYPATATAKITPAPASVATPPAKAALSPYNGAAQALVTAGTATDGTMMYSLDGTNYSYDIPTGTDAATYTVWYKAAADDKNHEDSTVGTVANIVISPNTDIPKVICTPDSFKFDGTEKAPTSVVVRDSNQHTIPTSEYILDVTPRTAVGNYTVTVTDKPGGNYEFSSTTGGTFKIETGSQSSLTIVTELYDVHYGDSFRLSATGGSGDGAIHWSIPEHDKDIATISPNGVVKVTGTGGFTVEAYREASPGYGQSNTVSLPFEAHAKPVTPIVTVADKPYDSKTDATLTAKFREGDLVGTDSLSLTVEGAFVSEDVGTGKQVNITKHEANGTNAEKYDIRWPDSVTGSIYKVDAKLQTVPGAVDLTYNKNSQTLLTPGSTVNNIGTIVYSTSQNGTYSTDIPTGTNAGTYSVWYKVADSVNYTGVAPAEIQVEIKKAEPVTTHPTAASGTQGQTLKEIGFSVGGSSDVSGKFDWADGNVTPPVGKSQQNVIFTPSDTTNYIPVTIQIEVTVTEQTPANPPSGETDTPNPSDVTNSETNTPNAAETDTPSNWTDGTFDDTPIQPAPVQNSPASTTVSAAEGGQLVQEAAANRSQNVVIQSKTTGNGTKAEASLLSATVSRLGSETDADLTVSSPIADVTIPNAALSTLSREGSTVRVMTEQKDQSVALTLAADGKTVNQVPGGVTLTVPVEDAGPGTVAVLVHDDGTRETVRKSIVEDGVMSIPLNGSATVEIVDNSKDFTDVPEGNWAADAVDFAASHELFNGTSETTFSPDQPMSRGMLATVLHRLEGSPETDLNGLFSDVDDSAYYAEGIAWAAENGITGGYGDDRFGPDDNITREQFVVMLWRYAGSPKASSQTLDFTDADQVSGFALEALCWAVENDILHGSGDGTLDPGGTATRAHAAQLLKNFMENT